jgi:hypothetical protein
MDKKEKQALVRKFSVRHTKVHELGTIIRPVCSECGRTEMEKRVLMR